MKVVLKDSYQYDWNVFYYVVCVKTGQIVVSTKAT